MKPTQQTSQRLKLKAQTLLALLFFLGFALIVAAPTLVGRVPVATDTLSLWGPQYVLSSQPVHNPVLADSALEYLPIQMFVRRSLAGGEWPLWNPDILAGHPFQGNPQAQLYYPVAWLLWLLPLPNAIQMNVVLHLWLAGLGMYALARILKISFVSSLLAGLAFAGSGQLYMSLELTGVSNIYVWLPWVIAATELSWRRRSWFWAAVTGLLMGVLAVSGNPQWLFYSGLFLAAWLGGRVLSAGWDTWRLRHDSNRRKAGLTAHLLRSGAILAWGPSIAAVHIFPFVELVGHSTRNLSLDQRVPYEPFNHTLRLLVPQFFGNSVGGVGEPLLFNNCWYIGLAPLALAAIALVARRGRLVFFLGIIGLVSLAVAAGVPFFDQAQTLPGFRGQLPERISYLFIFCAALLAGMGVDALAALIQKRPWAVGLIYLLVAALSLSFVSILLDLHEKGIGDGPLYSLQGEALRQAGLVAGILVLFALLALALRRSRWRYAQAAMGALLLAITLFDLLTYAPGYNTYVSPESLQFRARIADVMRADTGLWRMMPHTTVRETFPPNTAILYGLPDVQGYDGLHIARYDDFWAAGNPPSRSRDDYFGVSVRPENYSTAQADLLNVKYVTTISPITYFGQTESLEGVVHLTSSPPVTVAQTLLAPANLNSIDVAAYIETNGSGSRNAPTLTLHVRRSLSDTQNLVSQTVNLADYAGRRWATFTFPALSVRKGEQLVMLLESAGGARVALRSSEEDAYRDGNLYVGGKKREEDLAFRAWGELTGKLRRTYEEDVSLYTNIQALPRAFVVERAEVLPPASIPERVAQEGFDPRKVALIEQPPPAGFDSPSTSTNETTPAGTAQITLYRNLSVDITAQMSRAGWLVLGDVNYPGWNVEVDGQAAPLYTAYYILRAVPLSAGTHHVRFYFLPGSVMLGGAVSVAALFAALGTIAYPAIRRRVRSQV